jgi:hypothetical protein
MLCFIFRKKSCAGDGAGLCRFAGVLGGCLEKAGGWTWFFDGKNVVKCVVKRGGKTALARALKFFHFFNFIFEMAVDWLVGGRRKADFSTPPLTRA